MKVSVNENVCAGTGLCVEICPAVFKLVDGISTVKSETLADEDEADCRRAAQTCPMGAITLKE